jgi:hypothetical protein
VTIFFCQFILFSRLSVIRGMWALGMASLVSFYWLVRLVHYSLVEPIPLIEMVNIIGTYNIKSPLYGFSPRKV